MARTQIKTPGIADGSVTADKLDSTVSGALVPIGGIIMWSGTTIPTGWALCNGAPGSGTPDLRNRFIVAADSLTKTGTTSQLGSSPYDPGDIGGSADATIVTHNHTGATAGQTVAHTHEVTIEYDQSGGGGFPKPFPGGTRYTPTIINTGAATDTNHAHTFTTDNAGTSGADANLPPYYALAFIMRTS